MADKEGTKEGAAPAAAAASGGGGWMPVIAVVVLVPVLSFAMAMYVIAPQMEKRVLAAVAAANGGVGPAAGHGAAAGGHGDTGGEAAKGEAIHPYEFKDVVSNLAGSMRSRYIKVSFTAYSAKPEFAKIVEENKAKMLDATIGVLARLSLSDLEDAGAKNKVRNEIVYAMESVLHERVVEEIYFSEFVVQ